MTQRRVVLAPDILVAALYNPRARECLNHWRDGHFLPVVTRQLLVLYLRTLSQAGLNPDLIRKWSLWLTTPGKTLYYEEAAPKQATGLAMCREIAAEHKAELITKF